MQAAGLKDSGHAATTAEGVAGSGPLTGNIGSSRATTWLSRLGNQSDGRLRLFCFPYAGGDASIVFRKWPQLLPESVEVCPVQLPGRGIRVSEAPFSDLTLIIPVLGEALESHFDKPFAFFGHSMGALIGFELSRFLRKHRRIEPRRLFISGRPAPHIPDSELPTYNLPESEFLEELKKINGTPKEALEHPELMKLMLPTLQADFQLCQTYNHLSEPPLNCPITAFGGLGDKPSRNEMEAWSAQTASRFSLHMLPGDHFFVRSQERTILRILSIQLNEIISGNV